MAKTKNSVRGKQNKKIVPVKSYKRCDGREYPKVCVNLQTDVR